MAEKQRFDLSIDRVDKIPVPLLVVGLGGTGCDALLTIKQTFAERYFLPKDAKGQELPAPEKTAYLGIDSRSIKPDGFEVSEYVDITLPGIDKIMSNQKELLSPYERTWVNRNLRHNANGNGMGTIRQAARLALSRNYAKIHQAIQGALRNIVSENAGSVSGASNQLEIVIVTGIGGGTGSGIFLDMCQILRQVARETSVIPAKLTGYVVMPDVSLANVSAASGMEGPIKHNAYAALKELDFWMRVKEHEIPYSMQYGDGTTIAWKEPPFDYCILMSCSNVSGIPYKDGYMAVRNTIAENLMHYMAKEDAKAGQAYSYKQYEDNLAAIKVHKNYPLYYGYRAIGAFTKRIPKKSILYYEGSLLLKTFVPMRDDSGKLQPDRRMFTDGQGKPRAESITGNGPQLMQDFRTNVCRLPGFCNLDLNDKVKVTAMQNMNPAPHNKWHNWRDTVSSPAALNAAEAYLDKAWGRFEEFATDIIMDPEQGPFALEAYLDAPDGLVSYMEEILNSWTNQYNKTRNQSIAQGQEMCNNAWGSFCHPPLVGRRGALEQYDHAIKSLYTYVNNSEFLEKHTEALSKLILRVKEYLRDGLKPLCASIEFLEKEFNTPEQDDKVLVQDIYNLDTVQQSINDAFKEANANDKLSSEFLMKMAEISLKTQRNVDAKTSGVEFLCRAIGLNEMCQFIQAQMKETYGDVNNQSLDQIMIANVGTDVAAQQQWMDQLANSVLDSALPMFMQDAVFKSHPVAPYSYMSIPGNAKEHLKYIKDAFANHEPAVEPKASSQEDHIYALMAWDKMPLLRYGLFEELRKAYDMDLNRDGSEGIHLVRNGDPNADYRNDWSQLPSPKPYFLFARNSVYNEEREYEKVQKLVARGIACGMIKVRDEERFVKATVRVLYTRDGLAQMAAETILAERDRIKAEKNPATGDFYTQAETAEKLSQMLAGGKEFTLEEKEISPANVANVLGLEHEPCDPFDSETKADVIALEKARENHKRLCVTMTEAMIYCRPDLIRALQLQLGAVEEIQKELSAGAETAGKWENRLAFAETAADLFIFVNDKIFLGGDGYKYKANGNKYDIVTPGILAPDLKTVESNLLKAACFLADVSADQTAKSDLMAMLETAKRKYNDAIDENDMTLDEMNDLIEAGKDLVADLESDLSDMKHIMHNNPSMGDEIAHQVEMAEGMKKTAENRGRNFRKIAKGLD